MMLHRPCALTRYARWGVALAIVAAVMTGVVVTRHHVARSSAVPRDDVTCWAAPVQSPVVDPFRAPTCTWCSGNRGVEFGSVSGDRVRSPTAGTVVWVGAVAGTHWVVLTTDDQLRVSIGSVISDVADGQRVTTGMAIGVATGPVHLGVRRGVDYLDPARWLSISAFRARVVPDDGSQAAPAQRRQLCR